MISHELFPRAGVASRSMATDASCYADNNKVAFSGTDRWDDPISDPSADIDEAKEIVRRMIGRYPNKLALSAGAFKALKRHPKIKEQFKYTSSDSITPEMLASYFDIATVVIGKAVYLPTNAGEDELAQDVWGNDAILAFVPNQTTGNFQMPSFGYTYELNGYPQVETTQKVRASIPVILPSSLAARTSGRHYDTGDFGV